MFVTDKGRKASVATGKGGEESLISPGRKVVMGSEELNIQELG